MSDMSVPVDCLNSIVNSTNLTFVRRATLNECLFSKSAGFILLLVVIISLIINIYSLSITEKNSQISTNDNELTFGMFISSLCIIIISTPSVLIQCFLCRRLCLPIICRIEGFNSFFNGCTTMYMLVALSIIRYITTANSLFSINFQQKIKIYNLSLPTICFILGSIWAVPPLFSHMSSYVPEGLGFHCGLDWYDTSLASRVYFFLLFISVYFIPMIIIIYINISIQRTIYRLTHLHPKVLLEMNNIDTEDLLCKHISNTFSDEIKQRLQHFYDDQRFVIATRISVIIYLIAWTPYSIIALSQVFGVSFSLYKPWVMTLCALLAKLSMIINPIIYTFILKNREMPAMITIEEKLF
ncbi:unnamed protein product [Adineta steineri]|uniref:G-protein coupled receptors family 1 profile domain-containing protein n=1 Tax=Adineta steineri TaxID=433720 RepID=A0A818T9X5_9BILA|nr:unnamed protein product [Adineta steineri]CAF3676936.1 unnamed protein product [Adineta steineri]